MFFQPNLHVESNNESSKSKSKTMNYIDIIILIICLLFAVKGYRSGFIVEVANLAAIVLGIYTAFYFSSITAGFLKQYFNIGKDFLPVFSFVLTFILVVIAVGLVGKILHNVVDAVMLGFVNRLFGAVFGVIIGILLVSLLFMFLNLWMPKLIDKETQKESKLYEPVEKIANVLFDHFDNLKDIDFDLPDVDDIDMKKFSI